jgi:hypothetical protein
MAGIVSADLAERLLGLVLPAPVRSSGAVLIASNLLPLYGVIAWDWPVFYVMALYWAENVLAGVFTLLRMLAANPLPAIPLGAFFCFHYGMFCFVHGVFVNSLFNSGPDRGGEVLALVQALAAAPGLAGATLLLALSHGWSFVAHVLSAPRESREQDLRKIMMRPYGRMVVLHIAILVGGFAVTALDTPVAALVVLILLKIALDLGLHNRANLPRGTVAPAAPESAA